MYRQTSLIRLLPGHWISGRNAGVGCALFDIRAGLVYARTTDGEETFGRPEEFVAETGESGAELLNSAMPHPAWLRLFQGAVRESLAAAHAVAKIGWQETHAWERPFRYVADDNEGNVGIVAFVPDGAVAAVSGREFRRAFACEEAILGAPQAMQSALGDLCDLPLLRTNQAGVSGIFWSNEDVIEGPEPWFRTYLFGAEIFRLELLSESEWEEEGAHHHGLTPHISRVAISIAARATPRVPIVTLTPEELSQLVPDDAKFRVDALSLLFSHGLFERELAR